MKRMGFVSLFGIAVLLLGLMGCSQKEDGYYGYENINYVRTEYRDWEKYSSNVASEDDQWISATTGQEVENEFSASLNVELMKTVQLELGYTFSVSSIISSSTGVSLKKDYLVEFYYRPVYDIYEVTEITYKNAKRQKENGRIVKEVGNLSLQFGYKIYDENRNLVTDTLDAPSEAIADSSAGHTEQTAEVFSESEKSEEPSESSRMPVESSEPESETVSAVYEGAYSVNTVYEDRILSFEDSSKKYDFVLEKKGRIHISFQHPKIDSSQTYWILKIFDGIQEIPVLEAWIKGDFPQFDSDQIRLPAGSYSLEITPHSFSDERYRFEIHYETEDSSFETESNDSFGSAYPISPNTEYTGNMQSRNDIDYYTFELPSHGKISIRFLHDKMDSTDSYWHLILSNDIDATPLMESYIKGGQSESELDSLRLPSGKYYLKIEPYVYSNMDYHFQIHYEEEGSLFEVEENNSFASATRIAFASPYTGNIQSSSDLDFYQFTNETQRTVVFYFVHPLIDSSRSYWQINFYNQQEQYAIGELFVHGNESEAQYELTDLPPGEYFIKIQPYSYNNVDYVFSIN